MRLAHNARVAMNLLWLFARAICSGAFAYLRRLACTHPIESVSNTYFAAINGDSIVVRRCLLCGNGQTERMDRVISR